MDPNRPSETPPGPQCAGCGRQFQEEATFCPSCGTARDGAPRPSTTDQRLEAEWAKVRAQLEEVTWGSYEIRDSLGRGGMAAVYRGYDQSLRREVAIKVMSPALLLVPYAVERFSQEARTMAALKHPNIVGIHEVVDSPLNYLVMEYVEGLSLDQVLKAGGMLPVRIVQVILFHVGQALQHAHARGVVHRDIKPSNIMLDRDGRPMVMDFGIAKAIEGGAQSGATSGPIGTAEYMSPEQILVKPLTGASDQYSLGVVAYHLLAGELPFSGTGTQVMMGHLQQTPGPLSKYRRDCPPEVEKAVFRMMAKDPAHRFASVVEAVKALGGHAKPEEGALDDALKALAAGRPADPALSPVVPSGANPAFVAPTRQRRFALAATVAGLGAVAVVYWLSQRPAAPVAPPPGPAQPLSPTVEPPRPDSTPPVTVPTAPAPPPPGSGLATKSAGTNPPKVTRPTSNADDRPPESRPNPPASEAVAAPDTTVTAAPSAGDPKPSAKDEIEAQNRGLVELMAKKKVGELMVLYRAEVGTDASWQDKLTTLVREDLVSAGLASMQTDVQPDGASSVVGVNVSYRDPVAGGKRSAVLAMLVRYSRLGDRWSVRSFSLTKKPPA